MLLTLFTAQRLLLAVLRVPLLVDSTSYLDYRHFFEMARLSDRGLYPYLHFWVEYPPIFPWLNTLLYRFSVTVASGLSSETWYYTLAVASRVMAEIATFILIYMISLRQRGKTSALHCTMLYTVLFLPYHRIGNLIQVRTAQHCVIRH